MSSSPAWSPRKHLPHVAANCLPLHMLPAVYLPAAYLELCCICSCSCICWIQMYLTAGATSLTHKLCFTREPKTSPSLPLCATTSSVTSSLTAWYATSVVSVRRLTAPTDAGDLRDLRPEASATAFYQSAPVIVIDFTLVFFLRGSYALWSVPRLGSPAR